MHAVATTISSSLIYRGIVCEDGNEGAVSGRLSPSAFGDFGRWFLGPNSTINSYSDALHLFVVGLREEKEIR